MLRWINTIRVILGSKYRFSPTYCISASRLCTPTLNRLKMQLSLSWIQIFFGDKLRIQKVKLKYQAKVYQNEKSQMNHYVYVTIHIASMHL